MGAFPAVLTAVTVAYLWTKLLFFSQYRTKGIKLLFSEIILSRSLSLRCVSITAEDRGTVHGIRISLASIWNNL